MNTQNETVVSGEFFKQLREAGAAEGYKPVPAELEQKAKQLLAGNPVADMDEDMKRKLRNAGKKLRKAGVPGY